jgi:hypothetical protein
VAVAVLMIQFFAQLYFVAVALLTIFQANDNAKDVYAAFKTADGIAGPAPGERRPHGPDHPRHGRLLVRSALPAWLTPASRLSQDSVA